MSNFAKFIDFPVFLASFLIGVLVVYLYTDGNQKIYVYPTPQTAEYLQYRDKAGQCFSFQQSEVNCPKDSALLEPIPMQ